MKVAICVSEAVPFAKTGGLADVAGSLPNALKKIGVDPIVIMPGYGFIFNKDFGIKKIADKINVEMNKTWKESFDLFMISRDSVDFYFVKNDKFFSRENLYGTPRGDYDDNNIRFGFFSKAIFKVLEKISYKADIINIHDYHFALAALLIRDIKKNNKKSQLKKVKVVLTIHNLAYQGIYERKTLEMLGINPGYFTVEGIEFYGKINFMKAGIVYSDKITTVSPTYSKEILTPEFGYGLDGVLRNREKDISGIINGIDYNIWNPETDKNIGSNYSQSDHSGKKICKASLIANRFYPQENAEGKFVETIKICSYKKSEHQAFDNIPVVGMISRLSEQKGIDLLVSSMDRIMENELFLIVLGTGDEKYQRLLLKLQKKYSGRFSLTIGYSDKMSREIYSGSDISLMPSKYEPCGLGQLISLKYGTVPVVRDTGGLSDTIINIGSGEDIKKGGQGFKFSEYNPEAFYEALKRALNFFNDKKAWRLIVASGMCSNFSWDYSAGKYRELYEALI